MRAYIQHLAAFAAVSVSTVRAVSLSNIVLGDDVLGEDLPPACQAVYDKQIPGCTIFDLSGGHACSTECANGVIEIANEVDKACANADVSDSSVLGLFLLGQGLNLLCPGVQESSSAVATTSSLVIGSATLVPSFPASTTASSLIIDTSSSPIVSTTAAASTTFAPPPVVVSSTSASSTTTLVTSTTTSKSSTTNGGLVIVSSSPLVVTTSSAPPASTSISAVQQAQGNTDTGGGSPFDVAAGSGAVHSYAFGSLMSLTIALFAQWLA